MLKIIKSYISSILTTLGEKKISDDRNKISVDTIIKSILTKSQNCLALNERKLVLGLPDEKVKVNVRMKVRIDICY